MKDNYSDWDKRTHDLLKKVGDDLRRQIQAGRGDARKISLLSDIDDYFSKVKKSKSSCGASRD